MAPGARNKFGTPVFELRSFGSKCTVLIKALSTLLELFVVPKCFSVRALCSPFSPRYAPGLITDAEYWSRM